MVKPAFKDDELVKYIEKARLKFIALKAEYEKKYNTKLKITFNVLN